MTEPRTPVHKRGSRGLRNPRLPWGVLLLSALAASAIAIGITWWTARSSESEDSLRSMMARMGVDLPDHATRSPQRTAETLLRIERIQSRLDDFFRNGGASIPRRDVQTSVLWEETKDLSGRLARIEASLASPEHAASVPLMRRDIDTLQREVMNAKAEMTRQVDRVQGVNYWLIGLLLLNTTGTLYSAVRARRDRKEDRIIELAP